MSAQKVQQKVQRAPCGPFLLLATAWLPTLLFFTILVLSGCKAESVAQARAAAAKPAEAVHAPTALALAVRHSGKRTASKTPPPGPGDTVLIYNARKGTWEDGLLRDVPAQGEFIHADRLMRLRGSGGVIQWVNDIDVSRLGDADAAYDPEAEHQFPEGQDVVYITGEDGYHALLAQVPPGRKLVFQGRIYETKAGAKDDSLQIRFTGITVNRVTNTFKRRTDTLVDLSIRYTENGNEDTISGTPEHPFFVPTIGSYVAMGKLETGTVLRTTDGSEATVVASTTRHGDFEVFNLEVEHAHNYFVSAPGSCGTGVLVHNTCWQPGPNDLDWRGAGKTWRSGVDEAFSRTGVSRDQFTITKWGRDANGKSFPVEWRAKNGAEVNIDIGHTTNGPEVPHIGFQTPGKRGGGGGIRGHILLDDVPVNR